MMILPLVVLGFSPCRKIPAIVQAHISREPPVRAKMFSYGNAHKKARKGDMPVYKNLVKLRIDYSMLMDLRVDYAFKILFTRGDPRLLISLLNAIFANKKIRRVIKSLTIKNPFLDKESGDDKYKL